MATSNQKVACLLGILPILMDFMEDVKYEHPSLYKRQIKKAGNEFIAEVEKLGDKVYKTINDNPKVDNNEFSQQVIDMGVAFREFIETIKDGSNQHNDFQADAEMQEMKTEQIIEEKDEEPEMPEGGWECSECGAPVENMNDYCSRSCFNAGMR